MIDLSTKMKNACEKDIGQVQKVIRYLQNNPVSTRYPKLSQYKSWSIVVFTDASYANLNDGVSSVAGLSMNILRASNKLLVQRGFFTNSAGDLLPTLGFLGGLYNFCNFVIIFSLM